MKRLQLYYWQIGIPVLLLALGTAVFYDAIVGTVRGNPHPQINYIIFVLIAVGCYQAKAHVWRINKEGRIFRQYRKMVESGIADNDIEGLLDDLSKKHDVVPLIQLIQELRGQPLSSVQHAAAESEMERFAARQSRRLIMSQFMGGLMVGMGLLGTFIGLLGALEEIGKLIGSFNIGAGMTDPLATISELVARLTAPMQAMGVAFSASLFGVLGSLIMGLLMVGVKGASADLVSFVQSDTALLMEIHPKEAKETAADEQLAEAMAQLAENSPVLQGLTVALDHSERRVRELLGGLGVLVSRVETSNHAASTLSEQLQKQAQQLAVFLPVVDRIEKSQAQVIDRHVRMVSAIERMGQQSSQHMDLVRAVLERQSERLDRQMREQQQLWHAQTTHQLQQLEKTQQHWQLQLEQSHKHQHNEWARWTDIQAAGLEQLRAVLNDMHNSLEHLSRKNDSDADREMTLQAATQQQQRALLGAIESASALLIREAESRAEVLVRVDSALRENQARHEQLVHFMAQQLQQAERKAV